MTILGCVLIAVGLSSMVMWRLGYDAGRRDELDRISKRVWELHRERADR